MKEVETPFRAYTFTAEELDVARNLGVEQKYYYQTLLSDAASEKLSEEYNPLNPLLFAQREAYLRGQMDILNMLLAQNGSATRPKRFEEKPVVPQPSKD